MQQFSITITGQVDETQTQEHEAIQALAESIAKGVQAIGSVQVQSAELVTPTINEDMTAMAQAQPKAVPL